MLKSRWVLTEKRKPGIDAAGGPCALGSDLAAKARWVVLGHTDPDLANITTFAPVLAKNGFFLTLQMIASFGWHLQMGGVSSAFMAGDFCERQEGSLYAELPPEGVPGVPTGSLVKLKKTANGLGDGPLKWFQCLLNLCLSIGFRQSPFDPCLLSLFEGKKLCGVLGLTVDDIIGGGSGGFSARCAELRARFRFGKWETRGGRYAGRDLTQLRTGAIVADQKYFAESLKSI